MLLSKEQWIYYSSSAKPGKVKVGLPEVRNYRLTKLDDSRKAWEKDVQEREMITPELTPLILLQIHKS